MERRDARDSSRFRAGAMNEWQQEPRDAKYLMFMNDEGVHSQM